MSDERGKQRASGIYAGGYEFETFEKRLGLGFLQNSDAFLKRFVLAQILEPPKALQKRSKESCVSDREET